MNRAMLTRTGSGHRATKQAALGDFISTDPPKDLMAPPQFTGITPFLIYTAYIVTLGPLLFGYHLVRLTSMTPCKIY